MTTIAYRDGVLAADSKAYGGLYKGSPGAKAKLHKIASGDLAGWIVGISTNNVGGDKLLLAWLEAGAPLPSSDSVKPDQFTILALNPAGELFLANDNLSLSGPICSEFYAIGSGDDFAMGAMAMGADAAQAVGIAALFDCHTGGAVTALRSGAQ